MPCEASNNTSIPLDCTEWITFSNGKSKAVGLVTVSMKTKRVRLVIAPRYDSRI